VEFEPDATDLGEVDTVIMSEREPACLRIGEGVIAITSLEAGISRLLSILGPPKECLEGFVETQQDIL
jgi:hypothetical protein